MTNPLSRLPSRCRRAAALATVLFASVAARSEAWGEEICTPPCAQGQVCYQRTCMIPAPPAAATAVPEGPAAPAAPAAPPAAPPASAPRAPGGYPPAPQAQHPGYGYPPQQAQQPGYSYPPAGYSAPPANGYPAQQYPAQQYPVQQYPAQQYPAQQYPTQQPYPTQPYSSQQPYPGQQYPYGYQPPPPRRSRVLVLPFIGLHSFVGNGADHRSVGASAGGLLGFRFSPVFSFAGELSVDVLNLHDSPDNASGVAFVMALVPQFHIVSPSFEIILGPKIGLWFEGIDSTYNSQRVSDTASGLVVGLNAGIFFPVGRRLSLGGLLTLDLRPFNRKCADTDTTNEICTSSDLPDALKLWGLAGALLF
jgi:hypothetical protein